MPIPLALLLLLLLPLIVFFIGEFKLDGAGGNADIGFGTLLVGVGVVIGFSCDSIVVVAE